MAETNVLVIEDESAIRDLLTLSLVPQGYTVFTADQTRRARDLLASNTIHIILLDWMLPGENGVEFMRWLRDQNSYRNIPVVMLTARAEEHNKIKALNIGADDYITKPFSPAELVARIKSILRRGPIIATNDELQFRDLVLNTIKHEVTIHDELLKLTSQAYQLLLFFLKHKERVYTRSQLLDLVWDKQSDIDERSVDAQIKRLRALLKPYGYEHHIITVRGSGYKFSGESNA